MTKEEVKIEITKVMKLLNIDYMPTRSELERVGLGYLMNHIARKCGGFVALRNEMGLKEKPKSKSWAEESVIKEIKEVIRLLNLNYFPSKNQMESLEEYKHLPNIIYRNGGCRLWAEKVGVELEETETKFGNDQEEEVKNL